MKKILSLTTAAACTAMLLISCNKNTDDTPGQSGGEKAVKEIIGVLEAEPGMDSFIGLLKSIDMSGVGNSELTVFAVRDADAAGSKAVTGLDSGSIGRHIAEGAYRKDELTDGKVLTSISGEQLYITREGDNVLVNGVALEGDEIPAGRSYIHAISGVIGEQGGTGLHLTATITVFDTGMNAVPGVEVTVRSASDGKPLGTFTTDNDGKVEVSHSCESIEYTVAKDGYTYEDDGYLIYIDSNGDVGHVDLNGDGILDDRDKVELPFYFSIDYDEGETGKTEHVYIMHE